MRGRRRLTRGIGIAALLVFLLVALGVVLPRPLFGTQAQQGPASRPVLLLSNAIHTDLAFPVDDALRERFGFLAQAALPWDDPGARFVVFGWGGREFYLRTPTWDQLEFATVARAFTLDRSVMHVAVTGAIDTANPAVTVLAVPETDYAAMLDAVAATFERDARTGMPVPVGQGYGFNDAFFAAKGRFNAFLGCNTWTGAMLRAGGLRTGTWTPLPPLLRWSLHLHNGSAQPN